MGRELKKIGWRDRACSRRGLFVLMFLSFQLVNGVGPAFAQPVPPGTVPIEENIKITKHNLSSSGLGTTHSATEGEICVFCHTPHGATPTGSTFDAPIWNRNLDYQSTTGYVLYDQTWSFSFEGTLNDPNKPTGYSRLCLSCHDGVIAIGAAINKPGSGGFSGNPELYAPTTDRLGVGTMATQPSAIGAGVLTGDTRVLGTNLQNDHPISFKFDTTLATVTDTELVDPGAPPSGLNDVTPLAPAGGFKTGVKRYGSTTTPKTFENVQCTSCHNPHAVTYPKFLRAARFQDASESGFLPNNGGGPSPATGQIICLYCHSKPGWSPSTHAVSAAVRAAYPAADDAGTPDPENYDYDGSHTVGAYACRNCHDPHTAQGAKRLHKEGVTTFGGSDSIENTCFLCHAPNATSVNSIIPSLLPAGDPTTGANTRFVAGAARIAPDIFSEFNKDNSACVGGSGTGSAMCLQLASGHDPVFVSRSQEGVQLKSEGLALAPAINEETPGINTIDVAHVECVDCHNPHQVDSPNLASSSYNGAPNVNPPYANGEGGRLKGMKGVGIDITGTRAVVVGRCCGTDTTVNGTPANRDPYVYEVCFRCHGNSYTNLFGPNSGKQYRNPDDIVNLTVPLNYASYTSIPFSPRSDPTNALTGDQFSLIGFSNKWRELNPLSHDIDTPEMISVNLTRFGTAVLSHTQQTKNPAYHPVVMPGRNGSPQLCKQLAAAFDITGCQTGTDTLPSPAVASNALANLTIQCTDCHNNNKYDAYDNTLNDSPVTPGFLGPLTESNLRPTDIWPALNTDVPYITGRPSQPIGPHGSIHRRILRANYDTDILAPGRCFEQSNPAGCASGDGYSGGGSTHGIAGGGAGSNNSHFQKFLLCFQCHDRAAFDPDVTSTYYGASTLAGTPAETGKDRSLTRFFGLSPSSAGVDSWWNGNLHMYHLRWSGAMCHECHYNIHSNIEALNTIYGDGRGGMLAEDSVDGIADGVKGTHLINFGPTVEGTTAQKPMWFYDGSAFRCYLRCHNEVMDSCAYQAKSTGTPNARWCAGGRNPGTSG